jgi:hypothetical protein
LSCGGNTNEPTTTEEITTEATTEAEVIDINTDSDASETDTTETEEATDTEATATEATDVSSDVDENGNVITILEDNDNFISVKATVFPGTWYVNTDYKSMGKATFYNVATKEDAYSNSPRIQVAIQDQETIDYYAESRENVADIDAITIDGIEYTGTTYTQYGMEWTEYKAAIDGTEEFMIIQISDVDTSTGEGADVLNSITFTNVTSDHMQGEE